MAAKKKAAAKKAAAKASRAPRQVWLVLGRTGRPWGGHWPTRTAAQTARDLAHAGLMGANLVGADLEGARVVGPYVLAERARER